MINHQNLIKLKLTFRKASKLLKNARLIQNRRAPKTRAAKSPGRAARPGADPWYKLPELKDRKLE